ncbi:hypothetical protein CTI12_AA310870 (mitochondrion) [Artemisia annua]|uniref:Uncharacterized protein n=1 Tax=Artemisia annua TaxID=35608 RepID=A0A2U1N404_ARTAN|nr:hypothetical protein CTI12_AA310870 [Artemisia annua]
MELYFFDSSFVEAKMQSEMLMFAREGVIVGAQPVAGGSFFPQGWDSFTCIPASTTKSSGLNAPTTAVQPFLGFVESGFPFTHNGGAAPTRQAATGQDEIY